MKKLLILTCLLATLQNCTVQETTPDTQLPSDVIGVCAVKNPATDLPWLKDMIAKAEEDRKTMKYKGNYRGKIWQSTWKGRGVFHTNFMLGSGALLVHVFSCEGKLLNEQLTPEEARNFYPNISNDDQMIYENL